MGNRFFILIFVPSAANEKKKKKGDPVVCFTKPQEYLKSDSRFIVNFTHIFHFE